MQAIKYVDGQKVKSTNFCTTVTFFINNNNKVQNSPDGENIKSKYHTKHKAHYFLIESTLKIKLNTEA